MSEIVNATAADDETPPITAPTPVWMRFLVPHYSAMKNEEIVKEVSKRLELTVENFQHLACMVRILRDRGVDVDAIVCPFMDELRAMADGAMYPGLLPVAIRNRRLGAVARSLPMADQVRVANDEPLPVMVIREGTGPAPRYLKPSQMAPYQVAQVFTFGKIRSEVEQINYLDDPKRRPRKPKTPITVDVRHAQIVVNGENVVITEADMLRFLQNFSKR